MMRRGTGFDADQARRLLPEERQDVTPLQLPADDDLTFRINAVDLENRLGDVETDCRDRLHAWLLQIVGALTAHTFMALTCRWRSRPQHHKQTSRPLLKTCSEFPGVVSDNSGSACLHITMASSRGGAAWSARIFVRSSASQTESPAPDQNPSHAR